MTSTTTCANTNAVVWHNAIGNIGLKPIGSGDVTNSNFAFGSSTCVTVSDQPIISGYNGINYMEYMFVAGTFLFFVSLMSWRIIFKPQKI